MARRFISPETPIGAVRRYFGLNQEELAWFIRVSRAIISHIEAGRRDLTLTLSLRLLPLLKHLPTSLLPVLGNEPLPATAPTPEAEPLEYRRQYCVAKAATLRLELIKLTARAVYASRWQQALPTILADLDAAAALIPASPEDADLNTAIRSWVQTLARKFRPSHAAQYHLMRLQAEAFETEAAALAELLAQG